MPRTRWLAHTRMCTKRGGPIFWIHENHVCPDCNVVSNTSNKYECLKKLHDCLVFSLKSNGIMIAAKTCLRANSARRIEPVETLVVYCNIKRKSKSNI